MNYLQLRQQFREVSGRFDLVDAAGVDTGAGFFINEGRKFLDRLDETQKSWASCFRFVEVGSFAAHFPHCRAIKEVWAMSTEERWQLEKVNLQDLIAGYLTDFPGERTGGEFEYYSPAITRYIPEDTIIEDFESYLGWVDVSSGNAHEFNSVLFSVPADKKLVVDIKGLFYSMELVNDTDENYWSAVHPMLLIMAAMRQIEIINRNTQGVNDWTASIDVEAKQLGMDLVEELIAEVSQMGG